jgi:hypothetical protein
VLDEHLTAQDHGHLVELRPLRGFLPAGRARHPGDADAVGAGVQAADQLADHFLADAWDDRRVGDVVRHVRKAAGVPGTGVGHRRESAPMTPHRRRTGDTRV